MKTNAIQTAISVLLVSVFASACTHVVVSDPPSDDEFFSEPGETTSAAAATAATATAAPATPANNTVRVAAAPAESAALVPVPAPAPAPVPAAPVQAAPQLAQECTARTPYLKQSGMKVEEIKVRASGFGAPPKAYYSDPQRRLMSMRAAKIDAYRSLAERVKGVQIWGGTTIGDMVVENDRFRVFLDTHLVGAKLIMQTPHEDGSYEATVEMVVGQKMVKDLVNNQIMQAPAVMNNENCVEPMHAGSHMMHTRNDRNYMGQGRTSRVAQSEFYFDRE
jgi:hypothetical protein